jgi:hypothetical protein
MYTSYSTQLIARQQMEENARRAGRAADHTRSGRTRRVNVWTRHS